MLEQCQKLLSEGHPLRGLKFDDPSLAKVFRELSLLSAKKVLYAANVHEDDLHGESPHVVKLRERAAELDSLVVPICARIEAELIELEPDERQEMLESLGLEEPALEALAHAAYKLLGLQSFFTAGEKEIRAWTIPAGATAYDAAGVIHSDFQRGFIRTEVYSVDDLVQYESEKAIREAGKMRVEGKQYVVQEGDLCYFLFNV